MKTTPKALVGWIAFAYLVVVGTVTAGTPDAALQSRLAAAALGQTAANGSAPSAEQKAADLLRRARQAMAENDLTAAEALISQAEALGVEYNAFHIGDTPKKARRDLERRRSAAATKPSQKFSPLGGNKNENAPEKDPFAGRVNDLGGANPAGVTPLPKVDGDSSVAIRPMSAPGTYPPPSSSDPAYPMTQPGENEARAPGAAAKSNIHPLCKARMALAVGDMRRAADFISQARAMNLTTGPGDDAPEKVENCIRKMQDLAALDRGSEAFARAYARNMMEQADALAQWGQFDEAERLADRAASMKLSYGSFEQKPQDLLARITAAKRQAAGPSSEAAGFADASDAAPQAGLAARHQAVELVRQARQAIADGDLNRAEALARQAQQLRLPDRAFAPDEDRPALVLMDIGLMRKRGDGQVTPAGGNYVVPAGGNGEPDRNASRAVYDPNNDPTHNVPAAGQRPLDYPDQRWAQNPTVAPPMQPRSPAPTESIPSGAPQSPGMDLFHQGEEALKARDLNRAYELFRQAARYQNDLDPMTAQRLQDHLQLLSAPSRTNPARNAAAPAVADDAAAKQQMLARQVAADLAHRESNARAMLPTDPQGALAMLDEARKRVEAAGLDSAAREQLLRRVDRAIGEARQYIEKNRPQLELADKNNRIRQDIERSQKMKVEVQEKLAMLIDECNRLMDEQRFEEAEVKAKQAAELDPKNPVVVQILWTTRFVRRFNASKATEDAAEDGFNTAMENVNRGKIPFDDRKPLVYPDAKDWKDMTARRGKFAGDRKRQRTEREIEIEKRLRMPVSLQFTNAPLSKVIDYLAKLAEVNVYLDPQGLAEEGVTTDTPVTIDLKNEIMLKSALNLILQPLHLSYVVKDEVLKITSEQMRDGQVYTVTYNVADLVVPIPNFVPTSMGLSSVYDKAMAGVGFGGGTMPFGAASATPMAVVANKEGKNGAAVDSSLLAQMAGSHQPGMPNVPRGSQPASPGPGGLGGGVQPDWDSLIDLITSTVKPTTWDVVGGPGSIKEFETNLSIVVSQTQDVHEELADLLEQLRRLQDLQVTIEVRFITLNDNFFERIGVDFDFDINDNLDGKGHLFGQREVPPPGAQISNPDEFNANQGVRRNILDQDSDRAITVGLSQPGVFNADLDIPFTQNSFALAVPQFGGFDATAGAQLGFAILSDIEAFFFISAAQGDRRSNVLQAPKVTLFNGQQAMVADQSQSPFVISVIPVVGDFAAAQQPVIVVLSEGTFMTVQAVVSSDRRFVRLTVVPFFSKIGDVRTFTFTGSTSATTDTTREGLQPSATDPAKLWNKKGDQATVTRSGTTVQLPTYSIVTVATTVSVPDGGTVLLGGIKRLSEGRNEFGVPMLNKLPYINRLFKNVGIGRETQSLMMMVTPRIIIQEEEEEKLGIQSP